MGRPLYPHELDDPDFSWLIKSFRETHPDYTIVENALLPVILLCDEMGKRLTQDTKAFYLASHQNPTEPKDGSEEIPEE